jgi:hypothetical protein
MIEGIHYDQYVAPVAMLDSIFIVPGLGSAQGKQAYIWDIGNAFQNTLEFDPSKRTYITLPYHLSSLNTFDFVGLHILD